MRWAVILLLLTGTAMAARPDPKALAQALMRGGDSGLPSYVEPPGGPGGRQRYATDPLQMLNDELAAAVKRGEMSSEEAVTRYRAALPEQERNQPPMTGRDAWRILNEDARPTEVPRLPKWGRP
jgi:hypothetical protein